MQGPGYLVSTGGAPTRYRILQCPLTYKDRGPAACHVGRGLVLLEGEFEVLGQVVVPLVQLSLESGHLLERQVVRGGRRVNLLEHLCEHSGSPEEGERVGQTGRLARKARLEPLLRDVFVVCVGWELAVDVLFLEELGEAEQGSREAMTGQ